MKDIALEATELDSKVVKKKRGGGRGKEEERHSLERLDGKEDGVAREMRKGVYVFVSCACGL